MPNPVTSATKSEDDGVDHSPSQHLRQVVATSAGTAAGVVSAIAGPPAMGLSGQLAQWGNVSALVLGGILFYQQFNEMSRNAREDRSIARETMQQMRTDTDRHYEQMRVNDTRQTGAIHKLTSAIDELARRIKE